MAPPVNDLLRQILQIEEGPHLASAPSGQRREGARPPEKALGAAALDGPAGQAPLDISKLDRIDVDCHDLVMESKRPGRAAGGGNAEDASISGERAQLNGRVLIHAPEQQLAPAGACVEAPAFPRCRSAGGTYFHAGKLADTQASTRKAKFLRIIPGGS